MPHFAQVEILSGLVRIYAENDFRSKYSWSATIRWAGMDTIEVLGALRAPTIAEYHASLLELKRLGVKKIRIRRIKNGVERWAVLSVERALSRIPE